MLYERSIKDFHASWQTCPLQSELRITIRFYQLLTIYNNLHDAKKRKHNEESRPVIYFIWVYFTLGMCVYIYIYIKLLIINIIIIIYVFCCIQILFKQYLNLKNVSLEYFIHIFQQFFFPF